MLVNLSNLTTFYGIKTLVQNKAILHIKDAKQIQKRIKCKRVLIYCFLINSDISYLSVDNLFIHTGESYLDNSLNDTRLKNKSTYLFASFCFIFKLPIIKWYLEIKLYTAYFYINTLSLIQKDVGEYFMINSSTGFLSQVKHFDYEDTEIQCNLGKGGGFVKIIAEVNLRFSFIQDV